jgi:hypothetical protein
MSIKKEELEKAYQILRAFERREIPPEHYSWNYILERVKASRATLWRNKEFKATFDRIKKVTKEYANKNKDFSHALIKQSHEESEKAQLKARIKELEAQLNRERERLVYAQMVARQHNIEPTLFMDKAPLNIGLITESRSKPSSKITKIGVIKYPNEASQDAKKKNS